VLRWEQLQHAWGDNQEPDYTGINRPAFVPSVA
jgi:hypothetical protein